MRAGTAACWPSARTTRRLCAGGRNKGRERCCSGQGLRGMAALGLVGLALLTGCATSSGTGFAQSQEEATAAAASGERSRKRAQRRARIR